MPNIMTIPAGISHKDLGALINAPGYNPAVLAEALASVTDAPHTAGAIYRATLGAAASPGGAVNTVAVQVVNQYGANVAEAHEVTFSLLPGISAVENYSWDNATDVATFYILTVGGGGTVVDASAADSRTLVNSGGGMPRLKYRSSAAGAATVTISRVNAAGAALGHDAIAQVLRYRAKLDAGSELISFGSMIHSAAFTA